MSAVSLQDRTGAGTAFAWWQIRVLLHLWLETDVRAYPRPSCGWPCNHLLSVVTLCNKAELYIYSFIWVPEIPELNYKLVRCRAGFVWLPSNEHWLE